MQSQEFDGILFPSSEHPFTPKALLDLASAPHFPFDRFSVPQLNSLSRYASNEFWLQLLEHLADEDLQALTFVCDKKFPQKCHYALFSILLHQSEPVCKAFLDRLDERWVQWRWRPYHPPSYHPIYGIVDLLLKNPRIDHRQVIYSWVLSFKRTSILFNKDIRDVTPIFISTTPAVRYCLPIFKPAFMFTLENDTLYLTDAEPAIKQDDIPSLCTIVYADLIRIRQLEVTSVFNALLFTMAQGDKNSFIKTASLVREEMQKQYDSILLDNTPMLLYLAPNDQTQKAYAKKGLFEFFVKRIQTRDIDILKQCFQDIYEYIKAREDFLKDHDIKGEEFHTVTKQREYMDSIVSALNAETAKSKPESDCEDWSWTDADVWDAPDKVKKMAFKH